MKIYARTKENHMPANLQVNKIGKYLNRNIDGAYKYKQGANMCDIFMKVYYQIPRPNQIPGKGKEYNSMKEMNIYINLTTYQNKLRVNIISMDELEKTIGTFVIPPDKITDLNTGKLLILEKTRKALEKEFEDYDFIF